MCNAHCSDHEVMLIIKRAHADRRGISIRQWVDPRVKIVEVGNWFPKSDIARALDEFRPDVVHAHLRKSTRMLARIKPKAATLVTLHLTVNGPHFAAMDAIVCIARWQHNDIPKGYRGRVFDIKLAYIPHRRLPAEEIQALRRELGVAPDQFLIGGVGRLAHSKGFDVLIDAFKQADLPNARLVIVGDGRERPRLERMLTPSITLTGFKPNAKDYYQVFDVFVCPSRREPLPYVMLEALDAGVPIIASTAAGNAELLEIYRGDLFPAGEAAPLATLLQDHCRSPRPHERQDLEPFSLDSIARQYLQAYETAIADKRQRAP